jgi:hypothetical protein
MKYLLGILPTLMLCQCTDFLPGRAEGIDPNPFNVLETQATAANRDPSRITVPVLRSPTLEKRWGKPRLLVGPSGGYALRYQDPADKNHQLTIFGSPKKYRTAGLIPPPYTDLGRDAEHKTFAPVEVSQGWQFIEVAGKKVRFYISEGSTGDQPKQYSTETFRLTAPDGRAASYRIRCASPNPEKGNTVEELMRTATF